MKPETYITTSWDDGHPLDFRVADLLARYGLRGTFYVPRTSEFGTMKPAQVRELSSAFEIGAHTLDHVVLPTVGDDRAWHEIADSRCWVEDSTGQACSMFCPPRGRFASRHLDLARKAGYVGVRSVELLSLDFPRPRAGLLLLPTTVQAHPHGRAAYARNLIRRAAFRSLGWFIGYGCGRAWPGRVGQLLSRALKGGGVFHLWGHSWELEQTGQWQRLEEVLRLLSQFTTQAAPVTNGELCRARLPSPVGGPAS
jgi:peptidoglycan/xylan/chitin deacetylase (PgdA/CDA1 family)